MEETTVTVSVLKFVIPFIIVGANANMMIRTNTPTATLPNIFELPSTFLKTKKARKVFLLLSPSSALIGWILL